MMWHILKERHRLNKAYPGFKDTHIQVCRPCSRVWRQSKNYTNNSKTRYNISGKQKKNREVKRRVRWITF